MKRRAFLGGGMATVAGLASGPALLDWRDDRQGRELSASAVPPAPGQRLGQRRLIWSVSTAEPLAALTFDDGPDPELTPDLGGAGRVVVGLPSTASLTSGRRASIARGKTSSRPEGRATGLGQQAERLPIACGRPAWIGAT
jgi:hypothetical protein